MALSESEQVELQNINQELNRRVQSGKKQSIDQFKSGMDQINKIINSKEVVAPIEQRIDQEIAKRGILEPSKNIEKIKSGKIGSMLVGAAGLAADPFQRAESGFANVGLQAQRDVIDPKTLLNEFILGVTGMKQGQFGDIAQTGLSKLGKEGTTAKITSAAVGLVATMLSPFAAVGRINRTFGKLTKFTDKGIKLAGRKLVSASDEAVGILGKELNNVYAPLNSLKGKADDVLFESVSRLPKSVVDDIVEQTGKSIEDIVLEPTVENLRAVKNIVGSFRPGVFKQADVGADILKEGKNINKTYSVLKNSIQDILKQKGKGSAGKKLLSADDAFSEIISASKFVKKQVVDKTLRKPTQAGKAAQAIVEGGVTSTRDALNLLKSAGGSARGNIVKAVRELEKYNKIVAASSTLKRTLHVAENAAAIGLLLKTPVGKSVLRGD